MKLLTDEEFEIFIRDPNLGRQPLLRKSYKLPPCKPSIKASLGQLKKQRCNMCTNCKRQDCGQCINCKDKPKFGGNGLRKRSCVSKSCLHPMNMMEDRDMSEDDIQHELLKRPTQQSIRRYANEIADILAQ